MPVACRRRRAARASPEAGVVLGIYLAGKGLDVRALGLFLSAGVLGGAVYAIGLGSLVARVGTRRALVGLTLLSAGFSFGLTLTSDLGALMACAFFGSLAGVGGPSGAGPDQPLEQTVLADATTPDRRAGLFALYRFGSAIAMGLGGLSAGLPHWLEVGWGIAAADGERAIVTGFSLCLLLVALLYLRLEAAPTSQPSAGPTGEHTPRAATFTNPLRMPSRRIILGLNGLFSVDQLGSSLTTAALMAYFFHTRFGLDLDALAALSFAAHLLSAISMWLSVKLADRIGLIRTMVFTHIPASAMLIALAFAPSAAVAVALWLGRGLLAQMDIPARDALTMSVVRPEERVAMASLHLVARNTVGTVGPTLATTLWHGFSASAPLLLGGILKVGYDLSLFALYRDLEPSSRLVSLPDDEKD
jgi:MFS family permease